MGLDEFLSPDTFFISEELKEKAEKLKEAIIECCCYRGWAFLESYPENELRRVLVNVHRDKKVELLMSLEELYKAVRYIRNDLVDRGYKVNGRRYSSHLTEAWKIEAPESLRPQVYVMFLGFSDSNADIPEEIEKLKYKLMTIGEAKARGFEFHASHLGLMMTYKGFTCIRGFFTKGARGWFDLTFEIPRTPGDFLKEHLEKLKELST